MNWYQRIDAAEKRGGFTANDRRKAGEWTTCACGRQDKGIPRFSDGEPMDDALVVLGLDFHLHVVRDRPALARTTLAAIEKRAAEVLAEVDHG